MKNYKSNKNNRILYINYISKYNTGEIRHQDFVENNFEYKNIVEIKNTYNVEPVALLDFLNKNINLYSKIIINLNNINIDKEKNIIDDIEFFLEYLGEIMDINIDIIFINKKIVYKTYNYK